MGDHGPWGASTRSLFEGLSFWNQESLQDKTDAGGPGESRKNKPFEVTARTGVSTELLTVKQGCTSQNLVPARFYKDFN